MIRTRGLSFGPGRRVTAKLALCWLLMAMVLAPTLGRLHQVVHAGALERVHAGSGGLAAPVQAAKSAAPAAAAVSPAFITGHPLAPHGLVSLISLLLPEHAPVDCLLLDQLALADALHCGAPALPFAVPAQAPPMRHARGRSAPHVALFQARGPPAG